MSGDASPHSAEIFFGSQSEKSTQLFDIIEVLGIPGVSKWCLEIIVITTSYFPSRSFHSVYSKINLTKTTGLRQPIPLRGNAGGRLYGWWQRKGPRGTCRWNISVLYTKSTWGIATRSLGRLQAPSSCRSLRIAIFAISNFTLEVVENCLNAFECFVLRSSKEAWPGMTFKLRGSKERVPRYLLGGSCHGPWQLHKIDWDPRTFFPHIILLPTNLHCHQK